MLTQIHIRDLATIAEAQLTLPMQNTMITGETGAGKSIFIEAIELALGARGSANLIRPQKERAEISLCFDISKLPKACEWLTNHDIAYEENECIVRRILMSDGRSKCFVNSVPIPLQLIRELGEFLFHLHSQHEQQMLLKAENQREIVDIYAEHLPLVNAVKEVATEWKMVTQHIQVLNEQLSERTQRIDYLHFQLEELETLQLQPAEWEKLEKEQHKLAHHEELLKNLQHTLQQLAQEDEQSVVTILNNVRKTLEPLQPIEQKISAWLETINSSYIQLNDLTLELRHYLESSDLDPQRLQLIEERVSQIFTLARKHKVLPQELIHYQHQLQLELSTLASSDDQLKKLSDQQKMLEQKYAEFAAKLSQKRAQAAKKLAAEITKTIRSLSLPYAELVIALEKETIALSPHGQEKIIFLIKTNPDQSLQPLAKAISGGELSRLSLATHLALAHQISTPTLIFDEVDTGVGGATAEKIGKLLRTLGETYQVFCITHQPQVAACGHHHLLVEKYFIEKTTHTRLRFLDTKEKTQEIARMLGGEKITEKTLEHAQEMLEVI